MSHPDAPITEPTVTGSTDVAEVIENGPPARKRRKGLFTAVIAAGVTLALMVGVGVAYRVLSGESKRPEQFTPASVVAYISVDLDPGLEQKMQMLKLAAKLPEGQGATAIKDSAGLLDKVLTQLHLPDVDVKRDLTSWLGMRMGLSLWLDSGKQPFALITATSRDDAKAKAGLARIKTTQDEDLGFVVRDGGALIAVGGMDAQKAAEAASAEAAKTPLATSKAFADARGWLADEQLAIAWADLDRYGEAMAAIMQPAMSSEVVPRMKDAYKGTWIVGVRLTGDGFEARYRATGTQHKDTGLTDALAKLGELPGNSEAGLVTKLADDFGKDPGMGMNGLFGLLGGPLGILMLGVGGGFTDTGEFSDGEGFSDGGGVTEGPEFPTLTDAEMQELNKLMGIEDDKRTKKQTKRLNELLTKVGMSDEDLTGGAGPVEGSDPIDITGTTDVADPTDDTVKDLEKIYAALAGATVSLAVTSITDQPVVRAIVEAASADAAKTLGTIGKVSKGDLTATVQGSTVTAVSKGFAPGGGELADQPGFQAAMAGAPASTELAAYINLAKAMPAEARAKFPMISFGITQGVEDGNQTGLVRLIIG